MAFFSRLARSLLLMFRRPPRQQYAALCYRREPKTDHLEVLLLTSRDTGRWVIPKGWSMPDKPAHGVAAQEGRIVVLTTNHRDSLDAALIRPGRIDLALEIGLAGPQQVRALFLRFHPEAAAIADELAAALGTRRLSPASVQQVLLAHADAREAAVALRMLGAA